MKSKKKNKIRVAVLTGGPSAEHDVSLKSGVMVLSGLDKKKYDAKPVVISRKSEWPIQPADLKNLFDVAFIAMHGEYGEDGKIQKILEVYGIPYTGSDSEASEIGMDKIASSKIFSRKGLDVPEFVLHPKIIDPPAVVKPADRGSSVGISIVSRKNQFPAAVKKALRFSDRIIVQRYIKGREMTCGVLEIKGKARPLLPTEIIPKKKKFFDFDAKYLKGASREITPPRLSETIIRKIQRAALVAHKAIGARGMSRTDFILETSDPASTSRGEAGKRPRTPKQVLARGRQGTSIIYVLEINTIPGMTRTSLLPQGAKAAGINFPQMLDCLIENAFLKR